MRRNRSKRQAVALLGVLVLCAPLAACEGPTRRLLEPAPATLTKVGTGGGSKSTPGATMVQGALMLDPSDAPALTTTCPSAGFTRNAWTLVFGKSGCLVVRPSWSSPAYEPYPLLDDLVVSVQRDGKNGPITHVRLGGQDVDGPEGIWHTTDWIPVAKPIVPTTAAFSLHVHATNVQIWRTDSHLGGGNRVGMIGTVSFGDIEYPRQ
jgi:hypothetical protein